MFLPLEAFLYVAKLVQLDYEYLKFTADFRAMTLVTLNSILAGIRVRVTYIVDPRPRIQSRFTAPEGREEYIYCAILAVRKVYQGIIFPHLPA